MKEIKLKQSWSEVTIEEYKMIAQIGRIEEMEIFKVARLIAVLSGEHYDTILDLPTIEVQKLAGKIGFISEAPKAEPLKKAYVLGDTSFVVHKDVASKNNISQYVDICNYMQDPVKNIVELMAVMLLPAIEKKTIFGKRLNAIQYGKFDIEESRELIKKHLSAQDYRSISTFFLKDFEYLMKRYLTRAKNQIKVQIAIERMKTKINSKRENGLLPLMELQEALTNLGNTCS